MKTNSWGAKNMEADTGFLLETLFLIYHFYYIYRRSSFKVFPEFNNCLLGRIWAKQYGQASSQQPQG